ncbi:hypothetical protein PG993_002384 [Apiospora rasikravindrae]|uniref:Uncharacterized protein n=1 Tax=Apiospora rasikravindrae TaxID=990691 RepID=A0ABR1TWH3_9PEZI
MEPLVRDHPNGELFHYLMDCFVQCVHKSRNDSQVIGDAAIAMAMGPITPRHVHRLVAALRTTYAPAGMLSIYKANRNPGALRYSQRHFFALPRW